MNARTTHTSIALAAGNLRAEVCPDIGGSLRGFWSEGRDGSIDWLRRATSNGPKNADARDMACYPLVPFSNRVRDGRFTFEGRDIRLPLNFAPHPHVIHGHGWKAAWHVTDATETSVTLQYRHAADAWPWPYAAEQRITLDNRALTIAIALTNLGDTPMPAGIGLHPYFPRGAGTTISGTVEGLWNSDTEVMPTTLGPAGDVWPAGRPLSVDSIALDNCFTGWGKTLDIGWPGRRLHLTARGPLDFLIVFTPPGRPFFCAEPVSHCIDAVNLAATRRDTGLVSLGPDETLAGDVRFEPEQDG